MKQRLDVLIIKQHPELSREKAKTLITEGKVFVNGQKKDKAGTMYPEDADILVQESNQKYVSRGGYKLEKAIIEFGIDLKDKICMDVGASTGGFTDCMLQNGAAKVFSIDVGHGQLDFGLCNHEKVISMEKTNIRYLKPQNLKYTPVFSSIDVSFISLSKVLPAVYDLLSDNGKLVALIKPQFEAGKERVGKKGIVRDAAVHKDIIENIIELSMKLSFDILGLTYSPIRGPEGNIEYLIYLSKTQESLTPINKLRITVDEVVMNSHKVLAKEKQVKE